MLFVASRRYTSFAFDGWKKLLADKKDRFQRTFLHMTNRTLSAVWRRWVELVSERQEQRAGANRALGRWRLRFVAHTFEVRLLRQSHVRSHASVCDDGLTLAL